MAGLYSVLPEKMFVKRQCELPEQQLYDNVTEKTLGASKPSVVNVQPVTSWQTVLKFREILLSP